MKDYLEKRIEELENEIDYEKRRNEVCATSKNDLYYLDSLEEELEELNEKANNVEGMCCPMCEEELIYIPYKSKSGKTIHIYSHDNTCPFIAFEFVDSEDLDGFVEYMKKEKGVN